MAPETWGWLEYTRFFLGIPLWPYGQWQTTAAGKGHRIYGDLAGVRPNLQGDWTDELGKRRKMVGSKYHEILGVGFKYVFIFTHIWGRFPFWLIFFNGVDWNHQLDEIGGFWWISLIIVYIYNHPKSIFYVSKDDYIYIIFLFMFFMDITGAFCDGFCFFRRGFNLKSCQSHTWNLPNRSDRYDIMGFWYLPYMRWFNSTPHFYP